MSFVQTISFNFLQNSATSLEDPNAHLQVACHEKDDKCVVSKKKPWDNKSVTKMLEVYDNCRLPTNSGAK